MLGNKCSTRGVVCLARVRAPMKPNNPAVPGCRGGSRQNAVRPSKRMAGTSSSTRVRGRRFAATVVVVGEYWELPLGRDQSLNGRNVVRLHLAANVGHDVIHRSAGLEYRSHADLLERRYILIRDYAAYHHQYVVH